MFGINGYEADEKKLWEIFRGHADTLKTLLANVLLFTCLRNLSITRARKPGGAGFGRL